MGKCAGTALGRRTGAHGGRCSEGRVKGAARERRFEGGWGGSLKTTLQTHHPDTDPFHTLKIPHTSQEVLLPSPGRRQEALSPSPGPLLSINTFHILPLNRVPIFTLFVERGGHRLSLQFFIKLSGGSRRSISSFLPPLYFHLPQGGLLSLSHLILLSHVLLHLLSPYSYLSLL
jgi:hypothetical protein